MTVESSVLYAALAAALRDVLTKGRAIAATGKSAHELAHALIDDPGVARANVIANDLALVNDYAVHDDGEQLIGGRELTINRVLALGIAEALASAASIDEQAVLEQLIQFMSGPDVEHIQLVGLDADLELSAPVPIGEWDLLVADEAFLTSMLPVPALAQFQPRPFWSPETWNGMAMLRRRLEGKATGQLRIDSPRAYPEWEVWRPLTVLALAQPDIVTMWSDHEIEPGRDVYERLNRVVYDFASTVPLPIDPDDIFEVPARHSIFLEASKEEFFRQRVIRIAELLPLEPVINPSKRRYEAFKRIRLAAQRLLIAGNETYGGDATPWDPVHATEALLHYVIALEALVGQDTAAGEITRKIRQRAAVLAGCNDEERLRIDSEIARAYGIRSRILHGAEEPQRSDLDILRAVVRKVMVARLALDSQLRDGETLEQECDRALLSAGHLEVMREALAEFGDLTLSDE